MNPTSPNSCSPTSIHRYLQDELSESEQTLFLTHLDQCADCRRQLEHSAGDQHVWDTVTTALQATDSLAKNDMNPKQHPLAIPAPRPAESSAHDWERAWIPLWLEPSDSPNTLGRIGMFEALQVIGTGATGVVFLAREPALGREVAIKVLAPHVAKTELARQRFEREARATAGLVHPNIIPIYQVSEFRGIPFLVMQHFPESSLQTLLKKQGKLNLTSALTLAIDIAQGLAHAHHQGIIHRDIKPANILLSHHAQHAIVSDFGLAQTQEDLALTRSGILAGTPHFMSPEQARGEEVDPRSDLHSLGSVLFTMLTGKPPLYAESESTAIQRLTSGHLPSLRELDPHAPTWLATFLDSLLSPSKENRPANAESVVAWLSQSLAYSQDPLQHPLPHPLATPSATSKHNPIWKRPTQIALMALVLLTLGVALSLAWPPRWSSHPDEASSRKVAEFYRNNRTVHFESESNDSTYELVMVTVASRGPSTEPEKIFPQLVSVWEPGKGFAPPGTFYFVLPLDQSYTLRSTWRLRDNHSVDAPIINLEDTFAWDRHRHDRVTLLPPDHRPPSP